MKDIRVSHMSFCVGSGQYMEGIDDVIACELACQLCGLELSGREGHLMDDMLQYLEDTAGLVIDGFTVKPGNRFDFYVMDGERRLATFPVEVYLEGEQADCSWEMIRNA